MGILNINFGKSQNTLRNSINDCVIYNIDMVCFVILKHNIVKLLSTCLFVDEFSRLQLSWW